LSYTPLTIIVALSKRQYSFNPKPEAMAVSSEQRPHQQTTIASGFELNLAYGVAAGVTYTVWSK
jgi:hypothetical protein